jgi:AcrR family transcriptional regulator
VLRREGRPTLEEAKELDWAIREAALMLFLERGYEGTTMDAIAKAAATTKVSLYARFDSKDEVFHTVIRWATGRSDWPRPEPPPPDLDDLEGALYAIARAAQQRALDPSMVQLSRIAIAEAGRFPDLARQTHAVGWPRQKLVVGLLMRHAETGAIVAEQPEVLADHFLAMVAGMPARLAAFDLARDEADEERHLEVAVQLFLRGLRPT